MVISVCLHIDEMTSQNQYLPVSCIEIGYYAPSSNVFNQLMSVKVSIQIVSRIFCFRIFPFSSIYFYICSLIRFQIFWRKLAALETSMF